MRRSKRSRPVLPPSNKLACLRCRGVFRAPVERCPLDGARLHRASRDPLLGTWFAGRYLIEELVGDGPLGRVYRVRALAEQRTYALRVLAGEQAADPRARARFQRQAGLARRLNHPNVVPVAHLGTSQEGLPFLVTDYVSGLPLSQVVAREGPLERGRTLSILRQVASGLLHAHERGVLHRDLRPANVLLATGRGGESARIVDFAIGAPDGGAAGERRDMAGLATVLREMVGSEKSAPPAADGRMAGVSPDRAVSGAACGQGHPTANRPSRAHSDTWPRSEADLGTVDLARLAQRMETEPMDSLRTLGLTGQSAGSGAGNRPGPGPRSG